ncbi:MFS transporter [Nocardia pseudobrasiliensis]|uniref:Putative MFS family arabinose efflux permease n=1 Tax=Nocardia pseudobrasiliensis TaxID=45979 RepID=A0A370IB99_9NOCA|nr:MFS transporter [Nocardia pseudobrasiliensis]RDI67983.1 putative MFS family arabinose efflux permease [Nocardia pseudobrasiliensis]
MSRTARVTVVMLFIAWTVDFIDRSVIGFALTPIGDSLGLDHGQRGLVVSVFFLAYAAVQVPSGLLADRFGAVRMGIVGMLAWSVCTGLTALAWSLVALLGIRLAFGLTQGVFPAASVKILAERVEPEMRTTANGWVNTANACGTLLAAVIAGVFLSLLNWRWMFLAIAMLGVVVVVVWARWMPRPLVGVAEVADKGAARSPAWGLLRSPAVLGCAAMAFGNGGLTWGLTTWVPTYLEEHYGVAAGTTAFLAIAPTLATAIGIVVGGRLSDRLRGRPRVIVVPAMILCGAAVLLLPHLPSVAIFVTVLTVLFAASGLCAMPPFAVPLRALPAALVGTLAGLIVFGTQSAGIVFPLLFGVIVDQASYTAAFSMLLAGPLIAILAATLVPQNAATFRSALRLSREEDLTSP